MKDKVDKGKNRNLATDSLLRWNKLKSKVVTYYRFRALVKSNRLTLWNRRRSVEDLHNLLLRLHFDGLSNREITDYLNTNNIKPRRTEFWTVKNVFMSLKKLKKRREREISEPEINRSIRLTVERVFVD